MSFGVARFPAGLVISWAVWYGVGAVLAGRLAQLTPLRDHAAVDVRLGRLGSDDAVAAVRPPIVEHH